MRFKEEIRDICSFIGTDYFRVTKMPEKTSKDFPLKEVTPDELLDLRLSKKPGLVLKSGDKLFYTKIPKNLRLHGNNTPYTHLCGAGCKNVCKHCPKVDDWTVDFHRKQGHSFKKAVVLCGRIEKYDFIPYAFESFNTSLDAYGIIECENFVK